MKNILFLLVMSATMSLLAYDESDYLKWMRLKNTDGSGTETSFTRANWYDPEAEEEVLESVTAGKCYYVPKGLDLWTHKTDGQTFAGKSLAVAGLISFRRYSVDFVVNDLRLLPGGLISYASNARVKGKVTIEGTAANPSKINPSTFFDRQFLFYCDVEGTSSAAVNVGNDAKARSRGGVYSNPRWTFYSGTFWLNGSWANYLGKTTFKQGTHVVLNNTAIGGPVEVERNCILDDYTYTGTYSIPELTLDDQSELRFYCNNGATRKFQVSSKLSIPGETAYVSFYTLPSVCQVPLITLTGDAALEENLPDVSKLTLQPAMEGTEIAELPRNSHGTITDNGDGTKTVNIVWDDLLKAPENEILKPSATSGTIAHEYLRFEQNSGIYYTVVADGSVVYEVSKGVEFDDGVTTVKIGMSDLNCRTRECTINDTVYQYLDLIKLTGTAAANPPDLTKFVYADEYKFGELPRNPQFILVDGENGEKCIRLIWNRIWYMIKANGYDAGLSAFDEGNGSYWHTGELPPKDQDIDVIHIAAMHFRQYGKVDWPKLTVHCTGYSTYNAAYQTDLKKVNVVKDSNINTAYISDYTPHTFTAPIEVHGVTLSIGGWGSRRGRFTGAISGTGKLAIGHSSAVAQIINGDNSGFHGLVRVSGEAVEQEARDTYSYCELGNAKALGGEYTGEATLAWKAHEFTNVWITCASDVNLAEDTRGVCITGFSTLEVNAQKTLTITEPATYRGTVVKRGNGVLVLGSPSVKFLNAGEQDENPTADLNLLNIAAGTLKVTNANAVNGLQVAFAANAKLALDVAPAGDMAVYGVKNTAWTSPFVPSVEGGQIAVEFTGTPGDNESVVPICTIAKDATVPEFSVPTSYCRRTVTTKWQDNGDSAKTLYATISARPGLFLFVK